MFVSFYRVLHGISRNDVDFVRIRMKMKHFDFCANRNPKFNGFIFKKFNSAVFFSNNLNDFFTVKFSLKSPHFPQEIETFFQQTFPFDNFQ